jgi:hypothetical protein
MAEKERVMEIILTIRRFCKPEGIVERRQAFVDNIHNFVVRTFSYLKPVQRSEYRSYVINFLKSAICDSTSSRIKNKLQTIKFSGRRI